MYDRFPLGGVATGAGGTAAAVPWFGAQALWLGVAAFTLVSVAAALRRILPRR